MITLLLVGAIPSSPAMAEAPWRIAGGNRFETAALIAGRSFPSVASVVYLARGDVFADALAAGTLTDGPVLLVPPCGAMPPVVVAQIDRLAPDSVVALGGEAAVCASLLEQAAGGRAAGRVAGPGRYETAVEISRRAFPEPVAELYLASGNDSPDAVAGGTLTAGPILLVPPSGDPPQVVVDEIARLSPDRVVVLGGAAAVADATVAAAVGDLPTMRLAGPDRFATAAAIAGYQFGAGSPIGGVATAAYLARGDVFADAVAAGSLRDGPVLLVPPCGDLPAPVAAQLTRLGTNRVIGLGGPSAICDQLLAAAAALPVPEMTVPDTTVVLDIVGRNALLADDAGVLVFAAGGAPAVAVGDVIVSSEVASVAPQGLLRRVTAVTRDGDTVRVATRPARLADAIHEAKLALSVPLTQADLIGASGPVTGRTPAASSHLIDLDLSDEIVLYDADDDPTTTDDQTVLTGTFTYDATLDVQLDIGLFPPGIDRFLAALDLQQSAGLTLTARDGASWTTEPLLLWEGEFRCFTPSLIPILLCPNLRLELNAEGEVAASLTMQATQSAAARFGISYEDGAWSPISELEQSETFQPPTFQADAAAKAWIRGQLGVEIFDLAGPYVYADASIRAEATINNQLRCWGIYAGIAAGAGAEVDADLLGDLEDIQLPELQLLDYELLLAEDPVPHTPCEPFTRQGDSWFGTITHTYSEHSWTEANDATGIYRPRELILDEAATWRLDGTIEEGYDQRNRVGAILIDVEIQEDQYRRYEQPDGSRCEEHNSFTETGNIPQSTVLVEFHPGVGSSTPTIAASGYPETLVTVTDCAGTRSTSVQDWPLFTGEDVTVEDAPGGRRICQTITRGGNGARNYPDQGHSGGWSETIVFALADGNAQPDCP